jgi:hypothetical protein
MRWLNDLGVCDEPENFRKDVVDEVLSKKNGDPSPETVFRRIALRSLWSEPGGDGGGAA